MLVSGDDSESGEEHAERKRVSAAPRIKAGDLRDMKGTFGE